MAELGGVTAAVTSRLIGSRAVLLADLTVVATPWWPGRCRWRFTMSMLDEFPRLIVRLDIVIILRTLEQVVKGETAPREPPPELLRCPESPASYVKHPVTS